MSEKRIWTKVCMKGSGNKNLTEIQLNELMSQSHKTKSLSKGIKIISKTNDPQICCSPHGRRGLPLGLFNFAR